MRDFNCANPDDMKIKLLADRARYFKQNDKGVRQMCKAMEELYMEGRAEGKVEMVIEMIKNGLAIDMIAKISKLTVENIKEIASGMSATA